MCISWVLYDGFLGRQQSICVHVSHAMSAGLCFELRIRRKCAGLRPFSVAGGVRKRGRQTAAGQKFQLRALETMKSRKTFSLAAFFISCG